MTNLSAIDTNYRDIGDTDTSVWEEELDRLDSPWKDRAALLRAASSPLSALCLAMGIVENRWGATGFYIKPSDNNPMSLRPWESDPNGLPPGATGIIRTPDTGNFLRFDTPESCLREWKRRMTDPAYKAGVYTGARTLAEMINIYAPPGDVHGGTGVDNADIGYASTVAGLLRKYAAMEGPADDSAGDGAGGTGMDDIVDDIVDAIENVVFGNVPHPGYVDLQHTTADKREGNGWDNLGKRNPKFLVLHRMWGTLRGTDAHFGNASVPSLTDYGIGTANIDGADLDGEIHQYNDPLGYRSGWASGRVSAPYGDGKCIVDKYGVIVVNRDGVSVETSGYDTEPFTDFAWSELVKLFAYWIDQMHIPYNVLPLNPHTGCNAIIWHNEFTEGTGKECPFTWMRENTSRLYDDIAAYLKPFQTGDVGEPQPEPEEPEIPEPEYAQPLPIVELTRVADGDQDSIAAITTREADEFIFVGDRVEVVRETHRRQYASESAPDVGPILTVGETFDVAYLVKAGDGQWWYVTDWWTRILAADVKRIED